MSPRVAVLGFGEAGSRIAVDLVTAGATVQGFDPAVSAPAGVEPRTSDADAVVGADLVLSVNSAADAHDALHDAAGNLAAGSVWADLNTGSARLKRDLAARLARSARAGHVTFVDVALMTPVPGHGLRTPMLISGDGAVRYRDLLEPFGAGVTIVEGGPGEAATRKLLRSVFFKGLAAAVVESLAAAERLGLDDWLRANIADELTRAGADTVDRLVSGSVVHAVRRAHEMAAAAELLTDLGVTPRIAAASRDVLIELSRDATPQTTTA